jgi:hypothetical protein
MGVGDLTRDTRSVGSDEDTDLLVPVEQTTWWRGDLLHRLDMLYALTLDYESPSRVPPRVATIARDWLCLRWRGRSRGEAIEVCRWSGHKRGEGEI